MQALEQEINAGRIKAIPLELLKALHYQ